MAYSMDLRDRVLALYDEGVKTKQVAKQLRISPAWARRVKQRRDRPPRKVGGSVPKLDQAARARLAAWVDQRPDATPEELRRRVKDELGIGVSIGCLWNTLRALKLTFKKRSLRAAERLRPDVLAQREAFFEQLKDVPLSDVVVLDESYVTTQFTRLRGRSARGVRLVGRVPQGHWKLLTILAAISLNGVVAAASIDATTDADVFGAFIDEVLVPALRPGQVVVMDNLSAHKVGRVRAAIERAGCRLIYLPPYSPDFSPIEHMWSKLKQALRSAGARTIDTLVDAIGVAFTSITAGDCIGYFRHCGYTLPMK